MNALEQLVTEKTAVALIKQPGFPSFVTEKAAVALISSQVFRVLYWTAAVLNLSEHLQLASGEAEGSNTWIKR